MNEEVKLKKTKYGKNITQWHRSLMEIVLGAMEVEDNTKELNKLEKKAHDVYQECVIYMWERPSEYNNNYFFDIVELPVLKKHSSEVKNRVVKKLRKFKYIIPQERIEQRKKEILDMKLNARKIEQEKINIKVKKKNGLMPIGADEKTPTEKKLEAQREKDIAKMEKIIKNSRYFIFNREGIIKAREEQK